MVYIVRRGRRVFMKGRKNLKTTIFYTVSLLGAAILFIGTVKKVGWQDLLALISKLSLAKFLLLLLISFVFMFLGVVRWRLCLKTIGSRPDWLTTTKALLADNAFSYLTPSAAFGGEPLRLQILKEKDKKVSWAKAAATVMIDKGLDSTTVLLMIVASVFFLFWHYSLPWLIRISFLVFTSFLVVLAIFLYYHIIRRRGCFILFFKLFRFHKSRLWPKIQGHITETEEALHHFFDYRSYQLWSAVALTIARYGLVILRAYLIILFLGNHFKFISVLVAVGVAYLVSFLPLPGGTLGGFEISQSFVFSLFNLGSQRGLAYALVLRSLDIIVVGLGIAVVLHLALRGLVMYNNKVQKVNNLK